MARPQPSEDQVRWAATLGQRLRLLYDVLGRSEDGRHLTQEQVRAELGEHYGLHILRGRWSRLMAGEPTSISPVELTKIADYFDVDPRYLLQESGELPQQVEAELHAITALRIAQVKDFALRNLAEIAPDSLAKILKAIESDD